MSHMEKRTSWYKRSIGPHSQQVGFKLDSRNEGPGKPVMVTWKVWSLDLDVDKLPRGSRPGMGVAFCAADRGTREPWLLQPHSLSQPRRLPRGAEAAASMLLPAPGRPSHSRERGQRERAFPCAAAAPATAPAAAAGFLSQGRREAGGRALRGAISRLLAALGRAPGLTIHDGQADERGTPRDRTPALGHVAP